MKKTISRGISGSTGDVSDNSPTAREIHFYRANEKPYGAFSNLFRRQIVFEGRDFPTAEHAYQAGKARKEEVREWLLSAPTPGLVAMAAHGLYTWDIVPDWSQVKYDRMREVLHAKFTQHEDLKQLLLSTGDARLVEVGRVANAVNCTWGEVNGKGKNMLGVLLMELRVQLASASKARKAKVNNLHRQSHIERGSMAAALLKTRAAATTTA